MGRFVIFVVVFLVDAEFEADVHCRRFVEDENTTMSTGLLYS